MIEIEKFNKGGTLTFENWVLDRHGNVRIFSISHSRVIIHVDNPRGRPLNFKIGDTIGYDTETRKFSRVGNRSLNTNKLFNAKVVRRSPTTIAELAQF